MASIRIVHTRSEGTLIEGSCKGDGVWEIVRTHGFRFSRTVGLYIPRSRDNAAKVWRINGAADALRAAGHTVDVDVDNTTPGRAFADAEADRVEWAGERADRYEKRADRLLQQASTRWENAGSDLPPGGEPIKIGHHSEGRHRRAFERAHQQMHRAVEEGKAGTYWAQRAASAGAYETHRKNPAVTLRRIKRLEAARRRLVRYISEGWRFESTPGKPAPEGATLMADYGRGYALWRIEPTQEWHAEKQAGLDALDDELGYWRHIIAEAEAAGVKIWGRDDFTKGDYVIYHGHAVEVIRVNAKTLTIPWAHYWITGSKVVTVDSCKQTSMFAGKLHTDILPYDSVQGRIAAADLAGLDGAQAAEVLAAARRGGSTAER